MLLQLLPSSPSAMTLLLVLTMVLMTRFRIDAVWPRFPRSGIKAVCEGIRQQSLLGHESCIDDEAHVNLEGCQLTIYSPKHFLKLRRLAGISEPVFTDSLSLPNLKTFHSDSKSGQTFWKSNDGVLIVKSISSSECQLMNAMAPSYVRHVGGDRTLLGNVLGIYRVQSRWTSGYYMVCASVFSSNPDSAKYDLKGSSVGREKSTQGSIFKDNDLSTHAKEPILSTDQKLELLRILARDTRFLCEWRLMDYSLLLEIEDNADARMEGEKSRRCVRHTGNLAIPCRNAQLYLGLVDFLQRFTLRKQVEFYLKHMWHRGRDAFSCVAPELYAQRLISFVNHVL